MSMDIPLLVDGYGKKQLDGGECFKVVKAFIVHELSSNDTCFLSINVVILVLVLVNRRILTDHIHVKWLRKKG